MPVHCQTGWLGRHESTAVTCDFCDQRAIWHWKATYPDMLLCVACLDLYPEAWIEPCYDQPQHWVTTLVVRIDAGLAVSTRVGRAQP